jgi:hypothetical protein
VREGRERKAIKGATSESDRVRKVREKHGKGQSSEAERTRNV